MDVLKRTKGISSKDGIDPGKQVRVPCKGGGNYWVRCQESLILISALLVKNHLILG